MAQIAPQELPLLLGNSIRNVLVGLSGSEQGTWVHVTRVVAENSLLQREVKAPMGLLHTVSSLDLESESLDVCHDCRQALDGGPESIPMGKEHET